MPLAGQRILAADFTPAVRATDSTILLNVSTTPILGIPGVNLTFTAPTSGKANVTVSGSVVESGGTTAAAVIDYRIRETNSLGAVAVAAGSLERRLILFGNAQAQEASRTSLITGLTPGQIYYAEMLHSSYGTLVDIYNRTLSIVPLPA